MSVRALAVLVVLCGAGLLGWRWLGVRAAGRRSAPGATAVERDRTTPSLAPTERVVPSLEAGSGSGTERRPAEARPTRPVVVVLPAEPFRGTREGWTVEVQTWQEDSEEVRAHDARTDARGRAELCFDEAVHVDWLGCLPPAGTGLAAAFVEVHLNLEPGDVLDEVLEPVPGGTLFGRVVDPLGAPLGGVPVRACLDPGGVTSPSEAVRTVRTGGDGRYVLDRLPPDEWSVEVESADWLQVAPPLGRPVEGHDRVELEVGALRECGDLVAVPRHAFVVTVAQAGGAPLANVAVELEPLALHQPGLWTGARQDPDVAAFLGRPLELETGIEWPYGALSWSTTGRERALAFGVAGRWRLTVRTDIARDPRDRTGVLQREVVLPCGDVALAFPAHLLTLRGRVVDPEGQPVALAMARLDRRDGGLLRSPTGFNGRFSFEHLPPDGEYVLTLAHAGFVTGRWPVTPGEIVEPFVLRPGAELTLRLVDGGGAPVAGATIALRQLFPDVPPSAAERETFVGLEASEVRTSADGSAGFQDVPPGSARVAWLASDDRRELAGWVLVTGTERHALVVDRGAQRPVPTTTHVLSVVEAGSVVVLTGVQVLVATSGPFRVAHPQPDGRFEIEGRAIDHTLVVCAEGHRSRVLSPADCPPGSHEHRVALEPGDEALQLVLLDRDGAPLPTVDVLPQGTGGERCLHVLQTGAQRKVRAGAFVAEDGAASLTLLLPGTLHLDVSLGGIALGRVELGPDERSGAVAKRLPATLREMRSALEASLASGE